MEDTERVVESEVCDRTLETGIDARRDDDIDRNIRSIAAGATFM